MDYTGNLSVVTTNEQRRFSTIVYTGISRTSNTFNMSQHIHVVAAI
jgi:hypothetical protein